MKTMKANANDTISCKLRDRLTYLALKKVAKALCLGTETSTEAGDEILYGLPGVFSMEIVAYGAKVRLIKEACTLRLMKKAEKSTVLLTIRFEDLEALAAVNAREATIQKLLAEGRLTFAGKTKHLAAIMRASAAGDKQLLPNGDYDELYGKDNED